MAPIPADMAVLKHDANTSNGTLMNAVVTVGALVVVWIGVGVWIHRDVSKLRRDLEENRAKVDALMEIEWKRIQAAQQKVRGM